MSTIIHIPKHAHYAHSDISLKGAGYDRVIDTDSPFARKLTCVLAAKNGSLFDVAKNRLHTISTNPGNVAQRVNKNGGYLDCAGDQSALITARTFSSSDDYTLMFLCAKDSSNASAGMICGDTSSNANYIWLNTGRDQIRVQRQNSNRTLEISNLDHDLLIWRAIRVQLITGTTHVSYLASGQKDSTTHSNLSFSLAEILAGHSDVSTFGFEGAVQNFLVFERALSDQEIYAFQRNPGKVLKPRVPLFYFKASAGGGTTVDLTGQGSTTGQGSLTAVGNSETAIAGQQLAASQGTLTVTVNVTEVLTGQQATASQGSITVTGQADTGLSGQQSAAQQGLLAVSSGVVEEISGQQASVSQGSLTVLANSLTILGGQEATTAQGVVTVVSEGEVVSITGQAASASLGALSFLIDANVSLAGQENTAEQGSVSVSTASEIILSGQESTLEQGSLSFPTIITLGGQQNTSTQGSLSLITANVLQLNGLEANIVQGSLTFDLGSVWTKQPVPSDVWTKISTPTDPWTIQ